MVTASPTLTLKPINFGYPNQTTTEMTTYTFSPSHVPMVLRTEYRHLRSEGCSRRAARWHVWRMIAMIQNGYNWMVVDRSDIPGDEFYGDGEPFPEDLEEVDEWWLRT